MNYLGGPICQPGECEEIGTMIVGFLLVVAFFYVLTVVISLILWQGSRDKRGRTLLVWKIWFFILAIPPVVALISSLL